jgi:hypothetical protein
MIKRSSSSSPPPPPPPPRVGDPGAYREPPNPAAPPPMVPAPYPPGPPLPGGGAELKLHHIFRGEKKSCASQKKKRKKKKSEQSIKSTIPRQTSQCTQPLAASSQASRSPSPRCSSSGSYRSGSRRRVTRPVSRLPGPSQDSTTLLGGAESSSGCARVPRALGVRYTDGSAGGDRNLKGREGKSK